MNTINNAAQTVYNNIISATVFDIASHLGSALYAKALVRNVRYKINHMLTRSHTRIEFAISDEIQMHHAYCQNNQPPELWSSLIFRII